MSAKMNYVCDTCGLYFVKEQAALIECPNGECQSARVWEFARKEKALQHARHIQDGIRSGLFRPVRPTRSLRHVP